MALIRKKKTKLTEWTIQDLLFSYLQDKGHDLIVPNCQVFGWEADLVSSTPRRYGHEYEIKISKADFKADKNKKAWSSKGKGSKAQALKNPIKRNPGPAYFWYVVPEGLIKGNEVPKHAGLIHVCRGRLKIIKKAPRLHSINLKERQINYISRGLMVRYWKNRGKK